MGTLRIGIDTGGRFTDFVLLDHGEIRVHKVRSTPHDPSQAIVSGLRELVGAGGSLDVVHGSTVATNAVLERKGAPSRSSRQADSKTSCSSAARRAVSSITYSSPPRNQSFNRSTSSDSASGCCTTGRSCDR